MPKLTIKNSIIIALLFAGCMPQRKPADADTSTLTSTRQKSSTAVFHPVDPSLSEFAKEFLKAKSNIDIAMYSMDVTSESPIIQVLSGDEIQSKLKNGSLKIRMVFEGYGTDEENAARSTAIEKLGVDVRWFASAKKVHHKFATIDSNTDQATLITGSANWSLGSMKNYDEAIVILRNQPGLATAYQKEFNLLWEASDEYGESRFPEILEPRETALEKGSSVSFNTANYKFNGKRITAISPRAWTLTHTIVDAIDSAKTSVKIATTRIVLRPVYNAILRAAERGVKIDVFVNQDQYSPPQFRKKQLGPCADEWDESCSKEVEYPWFLDSLQYPGKENVKVHVKFFSLNTQVTLAKQMHSKYVVIDDEKVSMGSFNWSNSSEYNHIENVLTLSGKEYPEVIVRFSDNHKRIFDQGRDQYQPYIAKIEEAIKSGNKIDCSFEPMGLTYSEIDYLLASGQRAGRKPFNAACK